MKRVVCTIGNAVANQDRAMEADTISKYGQSPKSPMSSGKFLNYLVFVILAVSVLFTSCKKDNDGLSSPEDFLKNPSVTGAVKESGIDINNGDNPPPLAGTYITDGEVVDASELLDDLIGVPLRSEFELYNQTASGKISFREKVGELKASGMGGYITGDNGKFTIYLESKQSGSEAGLPDDISANVVLLMSGNKLSNGDLIVAGITIITDISTSNKQYDRKTLNSIKGNWYMWEADFDLKIGTKSVEIKLETEKIGQSMREIMRVIIEKIIYSPFIKVIAVSAHTKSQ